MNEKMELPMLPLRGVVVFPRVVIHLDVGRESSLNALNEAMLGDSLIVLVAQKEAKIEDPGEGDLNSVGTIATIKQVLKLPGGSNRILVEGTGRVRINRIVVSKPFFSAEVERLLDDELKTIETEAFMRAVLTQFEEYARQTKKIPPEAMDSITSIEEPGMFADIIASHLPLRLEQKQEILEALGAVERLDKLARILNYEMEVLELEKKISLRVRKQMEKTQKEYYLREQVRAIQKELGDGDDRLAEVEEYRDKLMKAKLPEEVEKKALKELERLEKMPPAAAEAVVIRTYLDWILELPWSVITEDQLELDLVEEILDADHFGLEKVKERIIEYLAVQRLTRKIKGPILCLIGPPGVGKTSLARSIARALQRKFVRISLGGVRDEAEIRGHRRTYVGALPGRILQGMRQAKSRNPVFLLDEVDKMSTDFRGDPSAALLEVLDPEQNNTFSDHYLEIPFDLSQVMFITTANNRFSIPQPLLDRMEAINIPGYTEEEKVRIAQRHLIPKQLEENGLSAEFIRISEGTLRHIVREYTREAGVRNLEREIANIYRKTARDVVKKKTLRVTVTRSNLHKFLGPPRYRFGLAEKENEIGVATGVAWTETGGDLLAIEVTLMKGKGKLTLTGKLGDVMQESAQAALSYIRSRAVSLAINENFYEEQDVHIHVPEGAIPKDGPSAGVTIATALVSALTQIPILRHVAMTGEITLRGRVLPVGGVKEKVLAAHRAGIKTMLLPANNKKDLAEIPGNVRRRMEFVLVDHLDQILEKALVNEKNKEDLKDEDKKGGVLQVC
ncbi:MAG TPA: endopeptidase La [Firmicutes bacterium]|nr:endopeptidase La [Bacillota bacterium]